MKHPGGTVHARSPRRPFCNNNGPLGSLVFEGEKGVA